jgi:anti-sigma factor ChrR (cupin superfamily)
MSPASDPHHCDRGELVPLYALHALPSSESRVLEAHLTTCPECQRELESLRPVIDALTSSPAEILQPSNSIWRRLAERVGGEAGEESMLPEVPGWREPGWEDVAPGIACKLLATDAERDRVSMLVRLAPGVAYPPHHHSGVEELFLLNGELWIEDRKLHPGDYNRAEPGTADKRVWSETGCTCVLITSPSDIIS